MIKKSIVWLAASILAAGAFSGKKETLMNLIPYPAEMTIGNGYFAVDGRTIVIADEKNRRTAEFIAGILGNAARTRIAVKVISPDASTLKNAVLLIRSETAGRPPQEYSLDATQRNIIITAADEAGFFMAAQTLRLLLPIDGKKARIPAVRIADRPEFGWRGALLDVGRHFFPKESVKRFIDLISLYKFNVLHWHLTEDQGWRIEIKKYPRLTEVGAWRKEADGSRYGGFYTQDEIREIVAYAASRGVTVVPEIEMPGHSTAALAAYPELSCSGGPFEVATAWGVFDDVYCAGKDETFAFLKDVLDEVLGLFPSAFVHIGGDECPKTRWKECPLCQKRIKDEGLKNEEELQSWFIRRIDEYLRSKGRRLIGWDEILEGGLAAGAAVQVWRDWDFAVRAAREGHDVIMSPDSHCYFNQPVEALTLEKVYSFYPVPEALPAEFRPRILGGECTFWSERIPDRNTLDGLMFPRLLAMAENLWNGARKQPAAQFLERSRAEAQRGAELGVTYGPEGPICAVKFTYDHTAGKFVAELGESRKGYEFRYTLDGTAPSRSSPKIAGGAFRFKGPAKIVIQPFFKGQPQGPRTEREVVVHAALGASVTMLNPVSPEYPGNSRDCLTDGILGSDDFHDGHWQALTRNDMSAVVDLGEKKSFSELGLSMLSDANSWILFPYAVIYEVSDDGVEFRGAGSVSNELPIKTFGNIRKTFTLKLDEPVAGRYIKVTAKSPGLLPAWHRSKNNACWLFWDELIVKTDR